MIFEAILDFFFGIASLFLGWLPDIHWNVDTSAWQYAKDILDMIAYFLPIRTITAIIALVVDICIFRIIVALVRTIKGLIPFIG